MKQEKLGKRIASWFLCVVMVCSIVNLPVYSYEVNATDTSAMTYTEVFDFTDEGFREKNPITNDGIVSDITIHNSDSPVSISMHYDGDVDDYSVGLEYMNNAYKGICIQGCNSNTRVAVNSNCKIKKIVYHMSERKNSDSDITDYRGYSIRYKKNKESYLSESNYAQGGILTANGQKDYLQLNLDSNYEYYENEQNKACTYVDIANTTYLLAFIDSIEVTYEYITDENGWSVFISDDGLISWAPVKGAAWYHVNVNPGGGERINGTSSDLNNLCSNSGVPSGELTVKIYALDEEGSIINEPWVGTYNYVSKLEKLSTPDNIRLEGNVLKWDAVEHASYYIVSVYKNGSYISGMSDAVRGGSTQKSFTFQSGNRYKFCVKAYGNGYEQSEYGSSEEYFFESGVIINNVQISDDGILTWNPVEGAAKYSVGVGSGGSYSYGTSIDLNQLCAELGSSDGNYMVRLVATDNVGNWISEEWTGSYTYTSKIEKLAIPTNVRLEGNTLRWDSVEYATRYSISVYINGNYTNGMSDVIFDGSTQKSFILQVGKTYMFKVKALAVGYEQSDDGVSPSYLYKGDKLALPTNLCLEGNKLKWNASADATSYSVKVYENETQIAQKTVTDTEASFALVSGNTYRFEVVASGTDKEDSEAAIATLTYNDTTQEKYTIRFHMMGHGASIADQTVSGGDKVVKPVDPVEEGYTFDGWCTDAGCTTAFDFDTEIVSDTTIYAKWRCIHVFSEWWAFDETNHWHECTTCGVKKDAVENHDFVKYESNGDGTHKIICKTCGTVQKGHDMDSCSDYIGTKSAKPATLTSNGKIGEKYCKKCGTVTKKGTTIYSPKEIVLAKTSRVYTGKALTVGVEVKDVKGNTIPASEYKVTYSSNIYPGTATVRIKFLDTEKYSSDCVLTNTFKITVAKMAVPTVTNSGVAKATVSWKAQAGVTGYYVKYVTGDKTLTRKIEGGNVTSRVLTGLKEGATYKISVRMYVENNGKISYGEWSNEKELVVDISEKTITLAKTATTYTGKARTVALEVKDADGKVIDQTCYDVTYKNNKLPGTATVNVKFKGSVYAGSASTSFKINLPNLSAPTITNIGSTKATVNWKANNVVTGYTVKYEATDGTSQTRTITGKDVTSKDIISLQKNTTYKVSVRTTLTVDGKIYYSEWSKETTFTTKK